MLVPGRDRDAVPLDCWPCRCSLRFGTRFVSEQINLWTSELRSQRISWQGERSARLTVRSHSAETVHMKKKRLWDSPGRVKFHVKLDINCLSELSPLAEIAHKKAPVGEMKFRFSLSIQVLLAAQKSTVVDLDYRRTLHLKYITNKLAHSETPLIFLKHLVSVLLLTVHPLTEGMRQDLTSPVSLRKPDVTECIEVWFGICWSKDSEHQRR